MAWPQITVAALLVLSTALNALPNPGRRETRSVWIHLAAAALMLWLLWAGGFFAPLAEAMAGAAHWATAWPQLVFLGVLSLSLARSAWLHGQPQRHLRWRVFLSGGLLVALLLVGGFFPAIA